MLYKFLRIKKHLKNLKKNLTIIQKKNPQEFEESEEETDDDTDSEYDNYGFNKYGIHKDTTNLSYDLNNFYINGNNRFTNNKYEINGFDINGVHKGISINSAEDIDEEKMLKNTLWLKNRYNFLKSYIKLIKEKDITETVNNKVISSKIFINFMNAILYGAVDNNNIKEAYGQHLSNIEKYLDKSKSSKNVDKLKYYLIKIKNLINKNDTEEEEAKEEEEEARDDTRKKEKSDFNEYDIDINSVNKDYYNINGVDENGVDKNGLNINGIKGSRKKYPKRKVNWRDDDGVLYDQYGFDIDGFNKDGYDIYGFNKEKLNKDGLNKFGFKKNQVEA